MRIGSGEQTYEWIENWAEVPETESARAGWAHHGVAVTGAGHVIMYHPAGSVMLMFDSRGSLLRSWEADFADAHGITLVKEGESEYLWIADNGRKRQASLEYEYSGPPGRVSGQVVKIALSGEVVMRLAEPELPVYQEGNYSPTSVAVYEESDGGNGDIWVADGYGQSYVHRYDGSGEYVKSINGEEGGVGAFSTPHAVFIDTRKAQPELYIADRSNHRVQVYDMEGNFKRAFGSDFLTSPSAFVTQGDNMVIAELRARLAVVDLHDKLVGYLGDNQEVCDVDGWPNNKDESGKIVATRLLETGKFNSPHGLGVDRRGNLYVSEWLIGGRVTKLDKV